MSIKENNSQLLKKIITSVDKLNDGKVQYDVKYKPAIVDSVIDDSKAVIYFADDDNHNLYQMYNKTGEILQEDDNVGVYYTSNPAKGWIGVKRGKLNQKEWIVNNEGYEAIKDYEYISDTQVKCNGIIYTITKDSATGLISKVTDNFGEDFIPTVNKDITDTNTYNAIFWAVAIHSGLQYIRPYILKGTDQISYGCGANEMQLQELESGSYGDVGVGDVGAGRLSFCKYGIKDEMHVQVIGVYKSFSINSSYANYTDSVIGYIDGVNLTKWSKIQISYGLATDHGSGLTATAYFSIGEKNKVESHKSYDWSGWTKIATTKKKDSMNTPQITDVFEFDISNYVGVNRINLGIFHGAETTGYSVGLFIDEIKLIR